MIKKIAEFPIHVRLATIEDISKIKQIANKYSKELGFVNRAALLESIQRKSLLVADYGDVTCVGFVNYYPRKDGWNTVYEIATHPDYLGFGIGRFLLDSLPGPIRLKCTVDNPANEFYKKAHFTLVRTEQGRIRKLNVWERRFLYILCQGSSKVPLTISDTLSVTYGSRHKEIPKKQPFFVDIDWKDYDWLDYLMKIRAWKPVFAMVPDFTSLDQRSSLYQAIRDLKQAGVLHIGVCPKFDGAVKYIPSFCRVCISIPSRYAGFLPDPKELAGRKLHLLGGSPKKIKKYIEDNPSLNIISLDTNYQTKIASWGVLYHADTNSWAQEMNTRGMNYLDVSIYNTQQIYKMLDSID